MVLLAILCYAVSFYLMPLLDIIPVPGPRVATEHLGPGLGKNYNLSSCLAVTYCWLILPSDHSTNKLAI